VPGLGASFGRGAATSNQQDLANSDCILIMGSNMAEAHPVGFRWPMKAKEKGATLIHVDPHFSRTSACCNLHVPIRTGTDIVFLGALINYVIANDKWFKEYVLAYTNAATIIEDGFQDAEDLAGIFSGYDPKKRSYHSDKGHWAYAGSASAVRDKNGNPDVRAPIVPGEQDVPEDADQAPLGDDSAGHKASKGVHGYGLMGSASTHTSRRGDATNPPPGGKIERDPTLQHPRCVFQILKRHYARYTPEMVARTCGCTVEEFHRVADALCENSGRERTSAITYAVGWTQHTIGVQMIRAAGILQLLLGNMGRPGGGIMAMRGHCSIQGSTDNPTLYDLLPGYLAQPAADENHETLKKYCDFEGLPTGYWSNTPKFMVSLLKAWYGDAATKENEYHYDWLPRIDGDYSQLPFFQRMAHGQVNGYFLFGQNPAQGAPNAGLHRAGLRQLDWLVVLDWFEHESATFWKNDPKGPPPQDVKTEVFFMPAAPIAAKEGTFTNTQRLIQWHDKAVDPDGDSRSDLWFVWNLGRHLKQLYAGSTKPQDQAIQHLTWDYAPDHPEILPDGTHSRTPDEPDAQKVLQEMNGYKFNDKDPATGKRKLLTGFNECADDGSTACGNWVYSGIYPSYSRNRARDRIITNNPVQPDWAYAWPANRRIMYNRASADPQGRPWSERKRYMWWDDAQRRWVGPDVPDFEPTKPPDYLPPPDAQGMDAIAGDQPFIMKPDGVAWLFSVGALKDGPLPTHYEPVESPIANNLYKQQDNPTTRYLEDPLNPIAHTPEHEFPIIATTYRLTEHYLSGPMSRFNSWLNELQPEMFVELSPELAAEKGIEHGGWMTVTSPRGTIEARAMVTRRIKPLRINGRVVHQVGLPFHWGFSGECVGGQANDLTALLVEPNVSMHEAKAFTVDVRAGRATNAPPPSPTVPAARFPMVEPIADTPRFAQPEGRTHR
jgi:formate dehydrogenase major subunit